MVEALTSDFEKIQISTFDKEKDKEVISNEMLPYLREIYKDLYSKEIYQTPGLSKMIFKDYAQLPGCIEDRFIDVIDKNKDTYINEEEFLKGMIKVFVGTLKQKLKLTFKMYDFDNDGWITKNDVSQILSYCPFFEGTQNQDDPDEPLAKEVAIPSRANREAYLSEI
jgi:Ca2+-binding EF-hand superfamily protein